MAHGQASERLKELQRLVDADNEALSREFEGPSDTSALPESRPAPMRLSQSGGGSRQPRLQERLKSLQASPEAVLRLSDGSSSPPASELQVYLPTTWRTWAIILVAASGSILLLLLLFGKDVQQKVESLSAAAVAGLLTGLTRVQLCSTSHRCCRTMHRRTRSQPGEC